MNQSHLLARQETYPNSDGKISVKVGSSPLTHIYVPGVRLGVIGEAIVLYEEYDPDQYWLAFLSGAVLTRPPPDDRQRREYEEMREITALRHWRDRNNDAAVMAERLAGPSREQPRFPITLRYETDQYVLPFWEHREIQTDSEYHEAERLWEKAKPAMYEVVREFIGDSVTLDLDDGTRVTLEQGEEDEWEEQISEAEPFVHVCTPKVEQWCQEHCLGRYFVEERRREDDRVIFERYTDWFHCKLAVDMPREPD